MGDDQLRGWKEIASFLGTSPRTAQRWEAELSLPVHRLGDGPRAPVFAWRDELATWRDGKPEGHLSAGAPAAAFLSPELRAAAALEASAAGVLSAAAPGGARVLAEQPAIAPALAGPEEGVAAAEVTVAGDASGSAVRSTAGHSWRIGPASRPATTVAVAAVALIVVIGVSLALALRHPSSGPRAPQPSAAVPLIFIKLTSADGFESRMAIPDGGSGTITWGGRELQLSGRLRADALGLSVSDISDAAGRGREAPVLVASMSLRRGARATLKTSTPLTIEWVDVRQPQARGVGHP